MQGRDDYMQMDYLGKTFTQTNTRSCQKGSEGDGLNVAWRQAKGKGGADATHPGMEEFYDRDDDKYDPNERVHFARIYGTKPAFGNLGVQDYVFIQREGKDDDKEFKFKVRIWKNTGQGGTKVLADGNKYCNMAGHDDGRMDYVWTWSTGKMHRE